MGRPLSNPLQVARHQLMTSNAWLFFVEIPRAAGGNYRLVANSAHVNADGKFWQAASMSIEPPAEDADGSLGEGTIAIRDVSRLAMQIVEVEGEIKGQTLSWWLQPSSSLVTFDAALKFRQLVTAIDADERGIVLWCGHPANFVLVPSRVYDRRTFPQLQPTGGF